MGETGPAPPPRLPAARPKRSKRARATHSGARPSRYRARKRAKRRVKCFAAFPRPPTCTRSNTGVNSPAIALNFPCADAQARIDAPRHGAMLQSLSAALAEISLPQLALIAGMALIASVIGGVAGYGTGVL